MSNFVARKKQNMIHYPAVLDLSAHVSSECKREDCIYNLYAISNHSGNVNGGHYTSYIKNQNGKWYHYNDTSVKEVPEQEIYSPKAYCLFYRRNPFLLV